MSDEPAASPSGAVPPPPLTLAPGSLPDSLSLPDAALYIDGKRIEAGDVAYIHDPWDGERLGSIVLANEVNADRAALAAKSAFERMKQMPAFARRRLLEEIAARIADDKEDLATLIEHEAGKPKTLARVEVDRAIATFTLGAEEATRIGGEVVPLDMSEGTAGYRGYWQRVPRGPVLAISPFNFPLNLVAHKVAPALACGASVVLKPAPQTPLTALRLAEIVRAAGAPADALQVVPCSNEVAETLVRNDVFAVLSFTGSDKVGWHLKSIAGRKHVLLELGGNAACIVHEDAESVDGIGSIAAKICASAFNYAGQVCIKTQRLYVHKAVADRLLTEIAARAKAYAPQDPKSTTTTIGPMIDERAAKRVEQWIEQARAGGAEALASGPRIDNRLPATVLRIEGSGRGLPIVDEEAFGPVLTVHTYADIKEAIEMAGATRYGLQAGIYTDSMKRIYEAFDQLDVGALVVNDTPSTRIDAMPYGGRRDSGIGREGVRYAVEEMTDRKLLVMHG